MPTESTPLLPADRGVQPQAFETYPTYKSVLRPLLSLSFPVTTTAVFVYLLPMTSIIFSGRLGENELAGAGLATMWAGGAVCCSIFTMFGCIFSWHSTICVHVCVVTAYSVGQGLLTAFESLASQAFGSGNRRRVGILYQRAVIVLAIAFVPISALWWYMGPILLACKQPPVVVHLAEKYIRRLLYGLFPLFLFEATRRFLQVQGIARPMLYVSVLADCLHPLWNWLLIYHFDIGLEGAALATVISQSLMFFMLITYIMVWKPHAPGTWDGLSWEALSGFKEFMSLALPGAVMLCLEWWLFEFIGFLCGAIGTLSLSSNNIVVCVTSIAYTVPFGFSVSACTLCGNLLGAADPVSARRAAVVAMSSATAVSVLYACICQGLKDFIPQVWSNDDDVVKHTARLLNIVSWYLVLDAFQYGRGLMIAVLLALAATVRCVADRRCISQGVLRGCGKQTVGAVVAMVGFYVVTLPCAYALAFPGNLKQEGLWIGLTIGYIFVSVLYVLVVWKLNWKQASDTAVRLAKAAPLPTLTVDEVVVVDLSGDTEDYHGGYQRKQSDSSNSDDDLPLLPHPAMQTFEVDTSTARSL